MAPTGLSDAMLLALASHETRYNSTQFTERRTIKTTWFLLFLVVVFSPMASALPITYDISFTLDTQSLYLGKVTPGVAPTFGQFTYDATAQIFSVFTVNWNGGVFDLTADANNPHPDPIICNGATVTAAWAFSFLSGSGCNDGVKYQWIASPASEDPANTLNFFRFSAIQGSQEDIAISAIAPSPIDISAGFYSIALASNVPEPSALSLAGFGAAILMVAAIRRRRLSPNLKT
jgi:hypothetical protein